MTPRLQDGDLLHIIPRALSGRGFARGEVVVARPPSSALSEHFWIKRVVGLPGEYIALADNGNVLINDTPLSEPYRAAALGKLQSGAWLCDDGEYFLMGDNRTDSSDSRRFGPVHHTAIIGRVWLCWRGWRCWTLRKISPR